MIRSRWMRVIQKARSIEIGDRLDAKDKKGWSQEKLPSFCLCHLVASAPQSRESFKSIRYGEERSRFWAWTCRIWGAFEISKCNAHYAIQSWEGWGERERARTRVRASLINRQTHLGWRHKFYIHLWFSFFIFLFQSSTLRQWYIREKECGL